MFSNEKLQSAALKYVALKNGAVFNTLSDMLRYQLRGIRSAFEQLQLLNSVMTPWAQGSIFLPYKKP
jgi:hypothetical protein